MSLPVCGRRCGKCDDVVFSRTSRDYRGCSCGAIYVDGGIGCKRVIGDFDNSEPVMFQLHRGVDLQDLYDDWNQGLDEFGLIKKEDQHQYIFFVKET